MKKNFLIAVVLPLQVLITAPLSFYLGNHAEINFELTDVLPILLMLLGILIALLFLILHVFRKQQKIHSILSGVLVGLGVAVWVQSQLLVWNFGPLDGRGIPWSEWALHGYFELILWTAILAFGIFSSIWQKKIFDQLTTLLVVLAFLSIGGAYVNSDELKPKRKVSNSIFEFHPRSNTIVILLDTFQSDYFEKIKNENPEEVEFLDGFTFYRNTISSYPTTAPNMPAIFTGQIYRNESPFKEFMQGAFAESNLIEKFQSIGYETSIAGAPLVPGRSSLASYLNQGKRFSRESVAFFIDYGLFRSAPTHFKNKVYRDGNWLLSFITKGGYPPDYHGIDIKFLELFEERARVNNINSRGGFHFYQFMTPHLPLRVDENLDYDASLSGAEGYERQARGALLIVNRIIERLKSLGIYDSSEIVVMSDHGTLSIPLVRTQSLVNKEVTSSTLSSALVLFLHKKPNSDFSGVRVNDAPLYHYDLECFLIAHKQDNFNRCDEVNNALAGEARERVFYFYNWEHRYWGEEYMPPMTEWFISGHAYDPRSWNTGNFRYLDGQRQKIEVFMLYVGGAVMFTVDGRSSELIRAGWSVQENTHRWSEGARSSVRFIIEDYSSRNVLLRLNASGYLGGGLQHQNVVVIANGSPVAEWQVAGRSEYEAVIPSHLIGEDGLVNLVFDISDPRAPCDYSDSKDCRKLGISVRELVVDYAE